MEERIILVDENDRQVGTAEKMQAHYTGQLHRAFSIFIFNSKGEMLVQLRGRDKYHSGGLWTNTCCSHPREGEELDIAIHRRLKDEMGFDTQLAHIHEFIYKKYFDDKKLYEHEYDHVYVGEYDGPVMINPQEADGYMWIPVKDLVVAVDCYPDAYTVWFKEALPAVVEYYNNNLK